MRRLLPLLCAALAACGDPSTGAIRAKLRYGGFAPGCLRLVAQDASGSGNRLVTTLPLEGAQRQGERVIAVYPAEGWTGTLLIAEALERDCAGFTVARDRETLEKASGIPEVTFDLRAVDDDADGYADAASETREGGEVLRGTDCDDGHPGRHPGAAETCDGVDENCDGEVDEGVGLPFFVDADGDGFGAAPTLRCQAGPGFSAVAGDCDDTDPAIRPGATDTCNGLDDDCDGVVDEDLDQKTFYVDADGDGSGSTAGTTSACAAPPGYAETSDDCDDSAPGTHPGATEVCDGVDNDCDGTPDDGVLLTFHPDADQDGFGNPALSSQACAAPNGFVADGTDCDDTRPGVKPGAQESCNGLDDDCNGQIDDGVRLKFYRDSDLDGFGAAGSSTLACAAPSGFVADSTDCDDTRASVHPGATETCNGRDDDCNAAVDDGVGSTWYADRDGDGQGDPARTTLACSQPGGYQSNSTDCDDGNPFRHPGHTELCDGMDNDCDGSAEPANVCTGFGWTSPTGGGSPAWKALALHEPGKVWAAGTGGRLWYLDGVANVDTFDGECNEDWLGAHVTPGSSGRVYLAGGSDKVGWHDTGGGCDGVVSLPVSGLQAIGGVPGTLFTAGTDGKIVRIQISNNNITTVASTSATLFDIHGAVDGAEVIVLAVGGDGASPVIFRRDAAGTFSPQTLPAPLPTDPTGLYLRTVHVASATAAYAAGDDGVVLRWDGTGWTRMPAHSSAPDFTGVVTLGANLAYLTGSSGNHHAVWRFDGATYTELTTFSSAPRDVAASSPVDVWVAGDSGLLRRWSN